MRGMYQPVTPPPPCFSQVTEIMELKGDYALDTETAFC